MPITAVHKTAPTHNSPKHRGFFYACCHVRRVDIKKLITKPQVTLPNKYSNLIDITKKLSSTDIILFTA